MRTPAQLLPAAIGECSLSSLEALADYHEAVARQFRAAAQRQRKTTGMRRQTSTRVATLQTIPALYAGYAKAMSADAALRATMQSLGVPEETVHAWLKRERQESKAKRRHSNKAQAVEMMRAGQSNAAIARALGIGERAALPVANSPSSSSGSMPSVARNFL